MWCNGTCSAFRSKFSRPLTIPNAMPQLGYGYFRPPQSYVWPSTGAIPAVSSAMPTRKPTAPSPVPHNPPHQNPYTQGDYTHNQSRYTRPRDPYPRPRNNAKRAVELIPTSSNPIVNGSHAFVPARGKYICVNGGEPGHTSCDCVKNSLPSHERAVLRSLVLPDRPSFE